MEGENITQKLVILSDPYGIFFLLGAGVMAKLSTGLHLVAAKRNEGKEGQQHFF